MMSYKLLGLVSLFLTLSVQGQNIMPNRSAAVISSYIKEFNAADVELYAQDISNAETFDFLNENIPFFECPDKELEKSYYFRWWTYRKHIKHTPEGFVITEFLPDVPWAGKYNTISCAAVHHFYEGRWLKDKHILSDYAKFWLLGGGDPRLYSCGIADAIYNYYLVHRDTALLKDLYPSLQENFVNWETEKRDSSYLFWQTDDRDGMEMSVSGSLSEGGKGYRPTINSYMYGEAMALSRIATILNQAVEAEYYYKKADELKRLINEKLWDKESCFYKVIPKKEGEKCGFSPSRELLGYIPWLYDIPNKEYETAWKLLFDTKAFAAAYGPTTVEQSSPGFKISYEGHECQWNGPSWPYLTSMVLTALANYMNQNDRGIISPNDYLHLLNIYSNSQRILIEQGDTVSWLDENLNPYTGDWISRTRLKQWNNGTWDEGKGGIERGKDYNHSSFCNLIISGLMGIRPQYDGSIFVNPLVPDGDWDYFCLDNVSCCNKSITVLFDKDGTKYGKGAGFMIYVNGKCTFKHPSIQKVIIENKSSGR